MAVATSLAQCAIGLVLTAAATGHDIIRCGDLSNLVNRLDGVKMLALAGAAALLWVTGLGLATTIRERPGRAGLPNE